ncbi:MAG: hypothetical protein IPM64_12240 [Phycisphaerales bacterium]|nr:hypothetical protein [Phycisphaerales bacterium]
MSVMEGAGPAQARSDGCSATRAVQALRAMLNELGDLLNGLSDEHFSGPPARGFTGSIGAHVRHCLDHVAALADHVAQTDSAHESPAVCCGARDAAELDYDQRERGTAVERDRPTALLELSRIHQRLAAVEPLPLERPIRVRGAFCSDGEGLSGPSSLGRELLFVISHTVHHNALLAAMCAAIGVRVPARFGYAPATLAHMDRTACAPSASFR